MRASGFRTIPFCRDKYGAALSADVGDVRALPGFIGGPEPHALEFDDLMFVTEGRGALVVDGERHAVRPGSVLVTRAGEVRQWDLAAPLGGVALFFEREFVHGFFADASFLGFLDAGGDTRSRIVLDAPRFASSLATLRAMEDEIRDLRGDSDHALRAALYQLLVVLNRQVARDGAPAAHPPSLAALFRAHVERRFREMQQVKGYAALLGVTPEHLTRSVRRATGLAASDVIHQRIVLEAKRCLLYTDQPVSAIADDLSFEDPSYFNRFFKRSVGVTPRAFRAARRVTNVPAEVRKVT